MRARTASRRRMVAAATFAACLLLAGPAAYAAGAATADRENPGTENVAESGSGSGVTGSGSSGGHNHSGSASSGQEEDSGSAGSGSAAEDSDRAAPGQEDPAQSAAEQEDPGQEDPAQEGAEQDAAAPDDDNQAGDGNDDNAGANDGPDQAAAEPLDILASDCTGSDLVAHDGFQKAPRCVSTSFGEVAAADKSPSLLITDAPDRVAPGEAFSITVSTRNLVRDRFLPAAQGGYYVESSLLNEEGLQRGHFHTACRMLPNSDEAPDAAPEPLFFEGTEDGGGGSAPDSVTVEVPGVEQAGELQCSSWAGDGSHRTPMMQRANQTPAFDSVRVEVG